MSVLSFGSPALRAAEFNILLEPESHACDQSRTARRFALGLRTIGRLPVFPVPRYADVRRELAPQLVPKTDAGVGRAQPGADAALGIVLPEQLHLDERLEDQPVREEQLVLDLDTRLRAPRSTHVAGGFDLEPVRRQPLD